MENIQKLVEMITKEASLLKSNTDVVRREPADIMIAIQFKDGHIHTVLPHMEIVRAMANVIQSHLEKYDSDTAKDEVMKNIMEYGKKENDQLPPPLLPLLQPLPPKRIIREGDYQSSFWKVHEQPIPEQEVESRRVNEKPIPEKEEVGD